MSRNRFNGMHPTHLDRERGWMPEPNPFAPHKSVPVRSCTDRHIFIYADQLFYLVDTTTKLLGKARRGEQDEETIVTSEADGERPLFYNWFDKYIRKVEGLLSAYLVKPMRIANDNALRAWKEREIWLRMPDYWDDSTYDSLVEAIGRYVASGALYEYFKIRMSSTDPVTIDKAADVEDAELDIIGCANSVKPGSIHKFEKPF